MSTDGEALAWPLETALLPPDEQSVFRAPGSNLVLDLHGDPTRARLVLFSDGNHHMALADTLRAFVEQVPEVGDVFYATTPPRVIVETLKSGGLSVGNLRLSLMPHIFISPGDVLDGLHKEGVVGVHKPIMRSTGLAILIEKLTQHNIFAPADLLNPRIRLAISNPVTEAASFNLYETALCAFGEQAGRPAGEVGQYLRSDKVVKSQVIHHREIPALLAAGAADASLIYYHLALRYTRIFPDRFDLIEIDLNVLPDPARFISTYHLALVGDGGEFGARLAAFFDTEPAAEIYRSHGLQSVG